MPENPRLPDLDKPCDHFELRVENRSAHGKHISDGKLSLHPEIWLTDNILTNRISSICPCSCRVSMPKAGTKSFTCGCSVAGCACIVEGIHVMHDTGLIKWYFRRPQSAGTLSDSALKKWEQTALPVEMTFDRTQMVNATQDYLDPVRVLVGAQPSRFDWPVYGLSVLHVLKMGAGKPFYDL